MKKRVKEGLVALVLSASIALTGLAGCYKKLVPPRPIKKQGYSFIAFSDPHDHHFEFRKLMVFSKTLEPKADFLVGVGDFGLVRSLDDIIDDFYDAWYPVRGNHEDDSPPNLDTLAEIFSMLPNVVSVGPTGDRGTIYSFDYKNAHFIVLDGYYQGWKGNVHNIPEVDDPSKDQHDWLKDDLEKTDKEFKFVFLHEPAYPQTRRHWGDSFNYYHKDRDAFWKLLAEYDVTAFFAGHTHRYAKVLKDGVWHVNAGRACCDEKSLVYVFVGDDDVTFRVYRAGKKLKNMKLIDEWTVEEKK